MIYHAHTVIPGKILDLPEGWYVAVPESHVIENSHVVVRYDGKQMTVNKKKRSLRRTGPYRDKADKDKSYFLLYYLWVPDQLTLL